MKSQKRNLSKIFLVLVLITSFYFNVVGQSNFNEQLMKVGGDSVGYFNLHSLAGQIVGTAFLSNSNSPDIFIQSTNNYPDFSIYRYVGRDINGTPIFGYKKNIALPTDSPSGIFPSYIFQTPDKKVHLIWFQDGMLKYALFNEEYSRFESMTSASYPNTPNSLTAYMSATGQLNLILGHTTQTGVAVPVDGLGKYDEAGINRGSFGYSGLYSISYSGFFESVAVPRKQVSNVNFDILGSYKSLSSINLQYGKSGCLIGGSQFGEIYYYSNIGTENAPKYDKKKPIVNESNIIIRNPSIAPYPIAYPNDKGETSDIIVSSEGGVYYYKFTGSFSPNGNPVYKNAVNILEKNADLAASTLPVLSVVDWNNDGVLDIISGTSQGYIYFFQNTGSNLNPIFTKPEKLRFASGEDIQIQGGYGESTQGVGESRWGYTCPNVLDWNDDGYLDIVMGDITVKNKIIKGGSQGLLDIESLYCNGLELYSNSRVRPGIAKVGLETMYITLDEDNHLHLYWKIDDNNLEDGGKLKLDDGSYISTDRGMLNTYNETGRAKFEIADWDGDGVLDLLIGSTGFMSIPNTSSGIPNKAGANEKQASVLFLKNIGNNKKPRYQLPVVLTYNNNKLLFGWHACSPAVTALGGSAGQKNLIVADERGRFYFFSRSLLSNTNPRFIGVPVDLITDTKVPVRIVANDVKIYLDKDYYFQDEAKAFEGNRFTQLYADSLYSFKVKPHYDGVVYIASDKEISSEQLGNDWKRLDYTGLLYKNNSISNNYIMYYREVKEGVSVNIPSGNDMGTILLSSNIGSQMIETDLATISIKLDNINIYPNPSESYVFVEKNGIPLTESNYSLVSLLGEKIQQGKTDNIGQIKLQNSLKKGVYLLLIDGFSIKIFRK